MKFETTYPPDHPTLTEDAVAAEQYRAAIESAAATHQLQPCMIAGLGSRESRWGLALAPPGPAGTGDFSPRAKRHPWRQGTLPPDGGGFGRGLMQLDYDAQPWVRASNDWTDPSQNIAFACQLLADNVSFMRRHLSLGGLGLLRAAIAAYNCGAGSVFAALNADFDADIYTTHGHYSVDVLSRAGWFQQQHNWE